MTPERKERCDKVRKDLFDQTIHSDGVGIIMEIPKASVILEAFAKAIERETWLKAAEAAKEFSFHLTVIYLTKSANRSGLVRIMNFNVSTNRSR